MGNIFSVNQEKSEVEYTILQANPHATEVEERAQESFEKRKKEDQHNINLIMICINILLSTILNNYIGVVLNILLFGLEGVLYGEFESMIAIIAASNVNIITRILNILTLIYLYEDQDRRSNLMYILICNITALSIISSTVFDIINRNGMLMKTIMSRVVNLSSIITVINSMIDLVGLIRWLYIQLSSKLQLGKIKKIFSKYIVRKWQKGL